MSSYRLCHSTTTFTIETSTIIRSTNSMGPRSRRRRGRKWGEYFSRRRLLVGLARSHFGRVKRYISSSFVFASHVEKMIDNKKKSFDSFRIEPIFYILDTWNSAQDAFVGEEATIVSLFTCGYRDRPHWLSIDRIHLATTEDHENTGRTPSLAANYTSIGIFHRNSRRRKETIDRELWRSISKSRGSWIERPWNFGSFESERAGSSRKDGGLETVEQVSYWNLTLGLYRSTPRERGEEQCSFWNCGRMRKDREGN